MVVLRDAVKTIQNGDFVFFLKNKNCFFLKTQTGELFFLIRFFSTLS